MRFSILRTHVKVQLDILTQHEGTLFTLEGTFDLRLPDFYLGRSNTAPLGVGGRQPALPSRLGGGGGGAEAGRPSGATPRLAPGRQCGRDGGHAYIGVQLHHPDRDWEPGTVSFTYKRPGATCPQGDRDGSHANPLFNNSLNFL